MRTVTGWLNNVAARGRTEETWYFKHMSSIFFDYRQRKYAQALGTCQHYIGNSMRVIPIARDPSWSDLPLVGTAWGPEQN